MRMTMVLFSCLCYWICINLFHMMHLGQYHLLGLQFHPQHIHEKRVNLGITRATDTLLPLLECWLYFRSCAEPLLSIELHKFTDASVIRNIRQLQWTIFSSTKWAQNIFFNCDNNVSEVRWRIGQSIYYMVTAVIVVMVVSILLVIIDHSNLFS